MTIVRKKLKDIRVSQADLRRAHGVKEDAIDLSDIPEFTEDDFRKARRRKLSSEAGVLALHFEVYRDNSRLYRWRLTSPEGEILAISPRGYSQKDACESVIMQIRSGKLPIESRA
ncbi:MAG: YegP family protein [Hyphomonas sp.]|jgi:uncharacterized protein YegP (UPF0339 family)